MSGRAPTLLIAAVGIVAVAAAAGLFIWSGTYDIGADVPHAAPTHWLLETVRDRSVAVHAKAIEAPGNLNDPTRIATGAGLYAEMCAGCHLAPGMEKTEISRGLYPPAPELARRTDLSAAEEFWTIKHGIKMTAMPAWGRTHSDALIWDMVAFVRRMPTLDAAHYRATVKAAPADHDAMMEMSRGG
ncbi:MAG: cytochrome c [Caulobacteraceae bacterium]